MADVNQRLPGGSPSLARELAANSVAITTTTDRAIRVFTADDRGHSVEPWTTDGTVAGPALVKDIALALRLGFDPGTGLPLG